MGLANDLDLLKEFVSDTTFNIKGIKSHDADEEIDLNIVLGIVNRYWKYFIGS